MADSRKFGDIATTRGWIAADDVAAALDAQSELIKLGLPERVGEILRKRGLLTSDQVREILLEQGAGPLRDLVPGYEIVERLGQGGMGAVYRARRRADDSVVALKLLPPRLGGNPEFVARFVREARAAAELRHPNIVRGVDAGCADDHYFVAMELVEGESLDQRLRRKGALAEAEVLTVGLALSRALDYAHGQGLVHRDVKPGNIMLARPDDGPSRIDLNGTVKLCDLGLAKWVGDGGTAVTQTGLVVGTPQYVAPEQALGSADVDIRADIYSLGATLYHAATGRAPFTGGSGADVALRRLMEDPTPPRALNPKLSPGIGVLIERMLARERDDRPQDPAEVATAIEALLRGEGLHHPPSARRDSRTVGLGLAAAVVAALAVGSFAVAMGFNTSPATSPTPAPEGAASGSGERDRPRDEDDAPPLTPEQQEALADLAGAREQLEGLAEVVAQATKALADARELGLSLEGLSAEQVDALRNTQLRVDEMRRKLDALEDQIRRGDPRAGDDLLRDLEAWTAPREGEREPDGDG